MAVGDQSENSFFLFLQGPCHDNRFLLVLSTELIFVTQMSSTGVGTGPADLAAALPVI